MIENFEFNLFSYLSQRPYAWKISLQHKIEKLFLLSEFHMYSTLYNFGSQLTFIR